MIINPYRFAGGGVTLPTPLHWWDLDNLTTGLDDLGSGAWARLTNNGASVATGGAPSGSGDCLRFVASDYIDRTNVAWDGTADELTMTCWYQMTSISSSANYLISWRGASGTDRFTQMQVQNSTQDYLGGAMFDDGGTETMFLNDQSINNLTSQWYFGAVTFKGNTGKIYRATRGTDTMDLHESETNVNLDAFTGNTIPFAIGAQSWSKASSSNKHQGYLWGVGIWDEELSSDQLQTLYDQQKNGDVYSDIFA